MLSLSTLRNIFKKDFEAFFRQYEVKKRSVRIQRNQNQDLYIPIKRMIDQELRSGESFSINQLDTFLYDQLFYSNNNWHYIYEYDEICFEDRHCLTEVTEFFEKYKDEFLTDQLLTHNISNETMVLCTTRIEKENDIPKSINLLFKVGTVFIDNSHQNLFCGVTIDLEGNLIIIKFNYNLLENYEDDPMDVISSLKEILNGQEESNYDFFKQLGLNVIGFSEETPKKLISTLFKELSSEAEEILNSEVPPSTDNDIKDFLTEKDLPCNEDYIQQIKSVIFQEIAQRCANTMFRSGWVFRFIFREGQFTRASSRTENRSPIYGSKVYWHLKELIFKNNEMYEAGFFWYLSEPDDEEPKYVDVRFEARSDALITHYYYKMRGPDRKEKEEFVLRKIRKYFQENED
ncbi:hypothetical protein [Evansella tamaricis]|uniref:Uncharacterized protein n=1 Tax=Evansella tamaricis TaxID=2069301 RepID=A0ABS6JBL2_9BACI|nr:hypothetical protein [Evansella tamaricis]MBU9711040.1 hypothetical protein [Evansella tamaricis]